jgi:FtsP/CotA-like multicopper oxidase with cupredoxin domain
MKKVPRESAKSKKQRQEETDLTNGNGMTRRTALKLGAAAGTLTVLTSRKSIANSMMFDSVPPEPTVCSPQPTHSPATTPFVQALPIPPTLRPFKLNPAPTKSANLAAGEAPRADHQRWEEFLPQQNYDMTLVPANHTFHPDLGPTYCWTYNGIYPGPTIIGQYGIPIVVRFHNNLPALPATFGVPDSSRTIITPTSMPATILLALLATQGKLCAHSGITITGTVLPPPTIIAG